MWLVTADEMRRLDHATIEGGHARGVELMERAGAGVVEAMERRYGSLLGLRVLVLCGTGNNGGDGFVAARRLVARGAAPVVGILGDRSRIRGDAEANLARLGELDLPVRTPDTDRALAALIAEQDGWDLALDALLGTGARGRPEGLIADGVQALRELDERGTRVVAVDVPTGVDADTGAIARRAVRADLTVTFGAPKRGHYLYPGRAFVGALEVEDIGLAPSAFDGLKVQLATPLAMADRLPVRDPRAHKTAVGRVLVVGGSPGLTGAVALAARGAMRAGAGYVRCAVPAGLADLLAIKLTEAMPLACAETVDRTLAGAAFERVMELAASADVIALGSGLSRDEESAGFARRLVREAPCPLVVDADALNALAAEPESLADLGVSKRLITPHVGEMARLTGLTANEIESGRIDVARRYAERWRTVVVLKGAPTVIATPDGAAIVNPTGNPGLATAGTGDVLTGAIAALVAQGLAPADAAALGVYAHGMAGDLAAAERGSLGMVAGDVAEMLPQALEALTRVRAHAAPVAASGAGAQTNARATDEGDAGERRPMRLRRGV
jgi:ADP-dependent NAD(P)H-hydrate dehydratase / NAD(P)H-hydrate epimerase